MSSITMSSQKLASSAVCRNQSVKPMKSFEEWQAKRVFLSEFDINFNGGSPAIEMEAAQTLWKRSLDLHNIR